MAEEQKKALQSQLWNIANTLRGKMGADEFRDYILGFIFISGYPQRSIKHRLIVQFVNFKLCRTIFLSTPCYQVSVNIYRVCFQFLG